MEQVTKVDCDGRVFLVFEYDRGFWAVETTYVGAYGRFDRSKALKRDSKEAAIQAVVDSVGIDKIVEETGMSRLDAITKYYFG